jgi:hypothetical protein
MNKIIMAVFVSVCLLSTAYGIEYSANVISPTEMLLVEIDCPLEVQKKSKFIVNATITNPMEENVTDVIVKLVAQKNVFSYGQPKKRMGEIEGKTQTMVSWDVRAKQSGSYNISVIATGKAETTGENFSAQDQEMIIVTNAHYNLIDIIRSFIFRIYF